jgi:hypothetical protein
MVKVSDEKLSTLPKLQSRYDINGFVDLAGLQEKVTSTDSLQYELDQTRVMLDRPKA